MVQFGLRLATRLREAGTNWVNDDGYLLAASMSYYTALSFFPLLLVLTSGAGILLRFTPWGQDAQEHLLASIADQTSQALADQIAAVLAGVQTKALLGGPVGIVTLLLTTIALFAQFDLAFDRIWETSQAKHRGTMATIREILYHRLRAFLMLLVIGLVVILSFIAGMVLTTLLTLADNVFTIPNWTGRLVQILTAILLNWMLFALIYRAVPRQRVGWSAALGGACVATVTWEIGRQVLAALIIGEKYTVYGLIGSFIALMLWVYYAWSVLFLGAHFARVLCFEQMRPAASKWVEPPAPAQPP